MALSESGATICDSPNKTSICFGYATALEILRIASTSKLVLAPGKKLEVPRNAPRKQAFLDAIAQIEGIRSSASLESPAHILVKDPTQSRTTGSFVAHACRASLPGGSLLHFDDDVLVSAPAFAFTQIAARVKNLVALIQLGFELCGTYQTTRTGSESIYQVPPLASVRSLREFVVRNPSINGARKALRALRYIADGSASPRETKLALVLGLPMMYGGYGLGMPLMNYEIETNAAARSISGRLHLRCDLCWPQVKLDVEYQSREMHAGESSRIRDSRRMNALGAMGWTSIGVTNDELDSVHAMDAIADTIRRHIGKRRRADVSDHHARKLRLRGQLVLPVAYE